MRDLCLGTFCTSECSFLWKAVCEVGLFRCDELTSLCTVSLQGGGSTGWINRAIPENKGIRKKEIQFFSINDMHCWQVLTFLWSPIEWQTNATTCQHSIICYSIFWFPHFRVLPMNRLDFCGYLPLNPNMHGLNFTETKSICQVSFALNFCGALKQVDLIARTRLHILAARAESGGGVRLPSS